MTGPHLTPEREAKIRGYVDAFLHPLGGRTDPLDEGSMLAFARDLLAALDAEREAHQQTRTALDHTTLILARIALRLRTYAPGLGLIIVADEQIVENQRILGLTVAEADKPHDGNER